MTITDILFFALAAPVLMWVVPMAWRGWGIFAASIVAIAWLQYRGTGQAEGVFEIAALTVLLTMAVWWVIRPDTSAALTDKDRNTLLLCGVLLAAIWGVASLERGYFALTPTLSAVVLTGIGAVGFSRTFASQTEDSHHRQTAAATLLIAAIVVLLVVLKIPAVARYLNAMTYDTVFIEAAPLVWLGISYVAFRLIGLLRDFQYGRLPDEGYSLRDVMSYVLFFPAFTAGPIDQAQRFIPELQEAHALDSARLTNGSMRIAIGVFKKFVIADSLALIAMNSTLIERTDSMVGLWIMLYIYALQIYFDFSGYSDVAIGIGILYGLKLPENFDRPYFAPNIQQFWNRWHITLSMWFRSYFFSPISRALIRLKLPRYTDVLIAQVLTMVLIGLWHGVTANFFLWGLWHGVGLFGFKVISDYTRRWHRNVTQRVWVKRAFFAGSVFLTFHFVALGWVFFALPETSDSVNMLSRLFGG